MKKLIVLTLAVLLLTAMVGCSRGPVPTAATRNPTTNENETFAPNFTVYDVDGNPVKLSNFIGKPVVLNFWTSWCGPCKAEMPEFQKEFEDKGKVVQFLMINLTDGKRETVDTASAYLMKWRYSFPVYFDTESSAARAYDLRSIPATFFIDAQGHVVDQVIGTISAERLQQGISLILPEN